MIHVSEKAEDVLKDYFKEKEITPIRFFSRPVAERVRPWRWFWTNQNKLMMYIK